MGINILFTASGKIENWLIRRFWRNLGCAAVMIVTWHRMTEILVAIRNAGAFAFANCESDTQHFPRLHPWATFRFMTYLQPSLRGKLGGHQALARTLFLYGRRGAPSVEGKYGRR